MAKVVRIEEVQFKENGLSERSRDKARSTNYGTTEWLALLMEVRSRKRVGICYLAGSHIMLGSHIILRSQRGPKKYAGLDTLHF